MKLMNKLWFKLQIEKNKSQLTKLKWTNYFESLNTNHRIGVSLGPFGIAANNLIFQVRIFLNFNSILI